MIPKSELKKIVSGLELFRVINPPGSPQKMPRCVSAPVKAILGGTYLDFHDGQREIIEHYPGAIGSNIAAHLLSLSEKEAWDQYREACIDWVNGAKKRLEEAEDELKYVEKAIGG